MGSWSSRWNVGRPTNEHSHAFLLGSKVMITIKIFDWFETLKDWVSPIVCRLIYSVRWTNRRMQHLVARALKGVLFCVIYILSGSFVWTISRCAPASIGWGRDNMFSVLEPLLHRLLFMYNKILQSSWPIENNNIQEIKQNKCPRCCCRSLVPFWLPSFKFYSTHNVSFVSTLVEVHRDAHYYLITISTGVKYPLKYIYIYIYTAFLMVSSMALV